MQKEPKTKKGIHSYWRTQREGSKEEIENFVSGGESHLEIVRKYIEDKYKSSAGKQEDIATKGGHWELKWYYESGYQRALNDIHELVTTKER